MCVCARVCVSVCLSLCVPVCVEKKLLCDCVRWYDCLQILHSFCLRYLPEADFDEIHFFGDKFALGGNDYELMNHPRTIAHHIETANPLETLKILETIFPDLPAPVGWVRCALFSSKVM
jgi:hypothetical protein